LENVFSSKANLPINKMLKGERATTARKELQASSPPFLGPSVFLLK